jgi:hypothetical protein
MDKSEDLPEKNDVTPVEPKAQADPQKPYLQSLANQWRNRPNKILNSEMGKSQDSILIHRTAEPTSTPHLASYNEWQHTQETVAASSRK